MEHLSKADALASSNHLKFDSSLSPWLLCYPPFSCDQKITALLPSISEQHGTKAPLKTQENSEFFIYLIFQSQNRCQESKQISVLLKTYLNGHNCTSDIWSRLWGLFIEWKCILSWLTCKCQQPKIIFRDLQKKMT